MQDGVFSMEEFAAMMKRLLKGFPGVADERELSRLGRLGPKDPCAAAAVVLAAGEARTVEEALDFLAAGKRALEARQGFSVLPGGSAQAAAD